MPEPESSTIITLYSDVRATHVRWLWNPFIAIGKAAIQYGLPEQVSGCGVRGAAFEFCEPQDRYPALRKR